MPSVRLTLEHRQLFDRFLNRRSYSHSAFSFVNLFIWQDFFQYRFEVFADNLCVFATMPGGVFLYLPPLGDFIREDAVTESFRLMKAENGDRLITRIENVLSDDINQFNPEKYSIFQKNPDYGYRRV